MQHIIFGLRTETTAAVLGEEKTTPATASPGATAPAAAETPAPPKPRKGHGRNGADDYPRAPRTEVAHTTLQHGDPCPQPGCEGRLYTQRKEPAVLVRITGVAPPPGPHLRPRAAALRALRGGIHRRAPSGDW